MFIIGLLLSCSKPTLTASDELIIISDKCFVKYTFVDVVVFCVSFHHNLCRINVQMIIDCLIATYFSSRWYNRLAIFNRLFARRTCIYSIAMLVSCASWFMI